MWAFWGKTNKKKSSIASIIIFIGPAGVAGKRQFSGMQSQSLSNYIISFCPDFDHDGFSLSTHPHESHTQPQHHAKAKRLGSCTYSIRNNGRTAHFTNIQTQATEGQKKLSKISFGLYKNFCRYKRKKLFSRVWEG